VKASVIIPVYNGAEFVGSAIRSVLEQTERDLDLIVVDDGSTDDTREVVRRFDDPRLRLIEQSNAGPSAARNRGIAEARGEWVGFLDADDSWMPEKLAKHLECAAKHPEAGLIYSSVVVVGDDDSFIELLHARITGDALESLLFGNKISGGGSSVTIRRDVFSRVGSFDPSIRFGEDWELWLRIASAFPFAAVDEPLTRRVERPDSYGMDAVAMREDCLGFLNRAFETYAAAYREHRDKAIAEVYYRAAISLHGFQERKAASVDLVRTMWRNPRHPYAYRRLIRVAVSALAPRTLRTV
jgi:glycosyltransferase involved in cell wall biosynthesis